MSISNHRVVRGDDATGDVIKQHLPVQKQKFSGVSSVKVQRESLAESSGVFGRVFSNKMGRRLTVVEEGLFSGIATSTVQVSYTRYTFTCSQ